MKPPAESDLDLMPPEVAERIRAAAAQPPACPQLPSSGETDAERMERWLAAAQCLGVQVIGKGIDAILRNLAAA